MKQQEIKNNPHSIFAIVEYIYLLISNFALLINNFGAV